MTARAGSGAPATTSSGAELVLFTFNRADFGCYTHLRPPDLKLIRRIRDDSPFKLLDSEA